MEHCTIYGLSDYYFHLYTNGLNRISIVESPMQCRISTNASNARWNVHKTVWGSWGYSCLQFQCSPPRCNAAPGLVRRFLNHNMISSCAVLLDCELPHRWDRNESSNHALLLCKPLRSSLIPPAEAPTTIRSVTQSIMCWEIAQNQWFLGLRTWAPKLGLGDFKLENHWWKNKGCAISRLESRVE